MVVVFWGSGQCWAPGGFGWPNCKMQPPDRPLDLWCQNEKILQKKEQFLRVYANWLKIDCQVSEHIKKSRCDDLECFLSHSSHLSLFGRSCQPFPSRRSPGRMPRLKTCVNSKSSQGPPKKRLKDANEWRNVFQRS